MNSTTNLFLTRNSPLRTTIINERTNRPLFKIETPHKVTRKTTHINRVTPTGDMTGLLSAAADESGNESDDSSIHSKKDDEPEPEENHISANSDEVARIHWHTFYPHKVVFNGQILKRSDLLPKSGR
jgi:hypothetical protein